MAETGLENYSLDVIHADGGPKARGFQRILGITIEDIDYLEAQILARILDTPVSDIRDNQPYGVNCVGTFRSRALAQRPIVSSTSGPSGHSRTRAPHHAL